MTATPRNGLRSTQPAKLADPTSTAWINTAVFVNPLDYTYGNVGRVLPDVRNPGFFNVDFSMIENTTIWERLNLQFRAEAFNLRTPDPQKNRLSRNVPHFRLKSISPLCWKTPSRSGVLNLDNHVNPGYPNAGFSSGASGQNISGTFGTITSARDARTIQLGMKLIF